MSKQKQEELAHFGARLAELRKRAGYTQVELAEEIGVSQRVISYYEAETAHPPTALLPKLVKALGISADELLGTASAKKTPKPANSRLQRRLQQIEKLDTRQKRQILQFLDTFIEREKLKKKAGMNQ